MKKDFSIANNERIRFLKLCEALGITEDQGTKEALLRWIVYQERRLNIK